VLTASPKASPAAATRTGLPTLKAVLAVDGTVTSGLEGNSGLLPTCGTDHTCSLGCTALVPTAARLLVLLGLTARSAALRCRITTIAEEFLILGGKSKSLPAIAADELLILSHISLSSLLQMRAASAAAESIELIDFSLRLRGQMNSV
jgi:hypothetical protein